MIVFGSDTEVSVANLNSIGPFDAIVDADAGGNSGHIYTTLSAALSAGHRSIYVKRGVYEEAVTISNDATTIFCEGRMFYSSGMTQGVVMKSTVTIAGKGITIYNMAVDTASSGSGFAITGDRITLLNCTACACEAHGISITSSALAHIVVVGGEYNGNAEDGINVTSSSSGGIVCVTAARVGGNSGDGIGINSSSVTCLINNCACHENDGYGINVTAGTGLAVGCYLVGNTTGASVGLHTSSTGNITS